MEARKIRSESSSSPIRLSTRWGQIVIMPPKGLRRKTWNLSTKPKKICLSSQQKSLPFLGRKHSNTHSRAKRASDLSRKPSNLHSHRFVYRKLPWYHYANLRYLQGASGEPKIEDRRDSKSTRSEGDIKCSEKANVNAEAKKESDSKKANHKSSPGTSSGTSSGTSPGTSPGTSENNEDMDKEIHGVIPPVVNHQEEVSQEEGWKRIKRLKEITSNTKNAPLKIEEK